MKKLLAGVLVFLPMGAAAQDVIVTVNPIEGTFSAEYFGIDSLGQIFSSIAVRLTGDGPISITSQSGVYTSILTPSGATITGDGTNLVTFAGDAPGPLVPPSFHDNSNPFEPFTFGYGGSFANFDVVFYSQTTLYFINPPFANFQNMVNANGSLGPLTFRIDIVPAPASGAVLGLCGMTAMRRRRRRELQ